MFLEGILLLHSVTWSLHAVIATGSNAWKPPFKANKNQWHYTPLFGN
jgi:hypothetical protein